MSFDSYHTVAGLAVALTGFTGIVLALQHQDKRFSRVALSSILGTSVGAMLFAFVPELLMNVLSPEASWRVASGSFGLYHLFLIINHQARQLQFRKNTPTQLVVTLLSLPIVGLKIGVGLGFLFSYAYGIYFLGLLWCIGVSAYLFAMILLGESDTHR